MQLTENQEMYLNILNEFIEQEVQPRLKELDNVDEYPKWMQERLAELGFTRLVAPEEHGGLGESMTTLLLLVMRATEVNNTLGSLLNCSNNANKLLSFANEQMIEKYIPQIIEQGRFMGMAYTEAGAGSDSKAVQTTAVRDGDEWVINGTKMFISYRSACSCWQVSAKTVDENGVEGVSVFLVDANAPGVSYGEHFNKFGWNGSDTGEVFFKDCRVPAWALCGEINKGLHISLSTLDGARLLIGARAVGYAQGAFDKAYEYASQREQFGRKLTEFQVIQHYFADMYAAIEVCRGYVLHLAAELDAGRSIGKGGSVAKLKCTTMAQDVTQRAMEICGGMGLLREFGLARYYEDTCVIITGEGTSEIQKNIIFKSIAKERR
ncbi:MAG: acyl-CoA/acyl-ACP dehydrogenase [Propionibacteriaceae bacterium]|jgi:alkylation response protein AidB-like acyl-CoA dehydrogenase|nr:acyl-CoA/acyl-ACP dehydrogenase [Propionibacteriaceae bacterium]